MAADAAGVPRDVRPVDGRGDAAGAQERRPVRGARSPIFADLEEVRERIQRGQADGRERATGSDRTADQTATALFFSGNAQVQYTGALIDQADIRNMDIVDAARLFAAVNTSIADGLIAVWHAKLLYGFWRPITAINLADTDGNPATVANTDWVPLLTTPPYPDYVSGYSGVTGAFTRSLQKTLGTGELDVTLHSTAPAVERATSPRPAT